MDTIIAEAEAILRDERTTTTDALRSSRSDLAPRILPYTELHTHIDVQALIDWDWKVRASEAQTHVTSIELLLTFLDRGEREWATQLVSQIQALEKLRYDDVAEHLIEQHDCIDFDQMKIPMYFTWKKNALEAERGLVPMQAIERALEIDARLTDLAIKRADWSWTVWHEKEIKSVAPRYVAPPVKRRLDPVLVLNLKHRKLEVWRWV